MDISIIIVNYNTFKITCNCLQTVFANKTSLSMEIILIDNDSKDEDPSRFLHLFPGITLIRNQTNLGFGYANNEGMKVASGKYILLLNSDTLVNPDTLEKSFQFMESEVARKENIGLMGCKILNPDGSTQPSVFPYLQNGLFTFFKTSNPIAGLLSRILKTDKHALFNYNDAHRVGDISGAFMFFRADVCHTTGYFDTDFFMYCEDTEWCRERIRKYCSIYYYPGASIIHLGGQSAPQDLMYIQSKLSLSLVWYKKGWLNYTGYIIQVYLNLILNISLLPFVKKNSRIAMLDSIRASIKIFPYLFYDIPKYKRGMNSRKEKLVYRPAAKIMQLG